MRGPPLPKSIQKSIKGDRRFESTHPSQNVEIQIGRWETSEENFYLTCKSGVR